ncbi:PLP-dependent aminotransferase family protein [Tropicibacter naphthalenivorans]|uniref:HTH-type transcriptional regulatory protein GabR n=1 Tax=Tropicibacter naphthalenivorans TaxID=441103 RepID=A0A0P1GUP3_9RHOB|nr:PLP-dependent aminotransferase family protein [Tropicibacter naphthalenivorans]CUH78295.1 HTH-type transcriptional regulatory protein GabR [Tropicibacter naphthalenivorans]SMC79098.1 transcriptional regulator, GntR family [Tropicibacter naphthalenivorans]
MVIPVETFVLPTAAQGTLQARIQQMVAEGILSGRFRRGEKLPSSRRLAAHLGVSRITVTLAYTELLANDYLTSRGRSGYFVSDNAPEPPDFGPLAPRRDKVDWSSALAQRYTTQTRLGQGKPADWASYRYPFIYGQADATLFDHANWRLCATKALGIKDFTTLTQDQYDADDAELVTFIARHTLPRRGIMARPEEILITLGAQNALWLATQLLATQRPTAIENPCYPALRALLHQADAHITPVDVDEHGLPPGAIPDGTSVIFTTPSHQCPTSATLPRARRHDLLTRAAELGAVIVEDDYEFEMSFLGPPSPALKSLDEDGRVVYVGSFSKSLFPGLRLGYLVGSAEFIAEARALRASVLRHPPGHIQRTAAYFLSLGHYDALVRRIGRALGQRRRVMEHAIAQHGLEIAGKGAHGGSSFWMQAPTGTDTAALAETLRAKSVLIEPGAAFFAGNAPPTNYYRLAYSSIPAERIEEGVAQIAAALAPATNQG